MKLEKLIEVVEIIKKTYESEDFPKSLREELTLLLPEFIEQYFEQGRINELQKRVEDSRQYDVESVKKGLEIIERSNPKSFIIKRTGKAIEIEPLLKRIHEQIKLIEENNKDWGPLEVGLRFEMILDSDFNYLLMACKNNTSVLSQLEDLVLKKLKLLNKHTTLLFWGSIKGLFEGESWLGALRQYDDITPPEFWRASSLNNTRKKCAQFIVHHRPRINLRMLEEGADGFRVGVAGVAKLLSIRKQPAYLSNQDILIVRAAAELVAATERLTYLSPTDLARSIGMDPDGIIFKGNLHDDSKKGLPPGAWQPKDINILLCLMKKSALYVKIATGSPSNVEDHLWRFKLGHEVMAPKFTRDIIEGKVREIDLQKELCRFLLERGVTAFGKSFGRSQVDLYARDAVGEDFVVEAKVFKSSPSEGLIKKNLTQLLSYMNQELRQQPRGILVLFNCSDTLIMAPREWLNERVFILTVNIGNLPPSGRRDRIEIIGGEGRGELLIIKDGKI